MELKRREGVMLPEEVIEMRLQLNRVTNLLAKIIGANERPGHVNYLTKGQMAILAEECFDIIESAVGPGRR